MVRSREEITRSSPPETIPLELVELVLVMETGIGHQPNLPLT